MITWDYKNIILVLPVAMPIPHPQYKGENESERKFIMSNGK